ncbi:ankyrin repeat domain-containing protein [Aspergillus lucknowensis]|uniref:Ankyrin repeat-containing domain protein n=1 Tax=Aspergillus lucknowensis TaxID=176173 RepID=A0ABR4LNZ0_9EURO
MPSISLPPDSIDDLIYSARAGDLEALQSDLSSFSVQHSVPQSVIIASAIDTEPEDEGGTGSCLLHFPAANGNLEILSHLLTILLSAPSSSELSKEDVTAVVNHRNYSGNTPLHWASLNAHLECVKALVEAGADVSVKNEAGLDPVFLAERADWSTQEEQEGRSEGQGQDRVEEVELQVGEGAGTDTGPASKGRQVVEWLLASEKTGDGEGGDEK